MQMFQSLLSWISPIGSGGSSGSPRTSDVSILVVVDLAHRHGLGHGYAPSLTVSILVVVDLAHRLAEQLGELAGEREFQSLLSWISPIGTNGSSRSPAAP